MTDHTLFSFPPRLVFTFLLTGTCLQRKLFHTSTLENPPFSLSQSCFFTSQPIIIDRCLLLTSYRCANFEQLPCEITTRFLSNYTTDSGISLVIFHFFLCRAFVKCYCIYFFKNFQFFNFIQFSFKIMQIFYCARSQSVLNYIVVATSTKPLNFSSFKGSF